MTEDEFVRYCQSDAEKKPPACGNLKVGRGPGRKLQAGALKDLVIGAKVSLSLSLSISISLSVCVCVCVCLCVCVCHSLFVSVSVSIERKPRSFRL